MGMELDNNYLTTIVLACAPHHSDLVQTDVVFTGPLHVSPARFVNLDGPDVPQVRKLVEFMLSEEMLNSSLTKGLFIQAMLGLASQYDSNSGRLLLH